jgi:hypothetical protein
MNDTKDGEYIYILYLSCTDADADTDTDTDTDVDTDTDTDIDAPMIEIPNSKFQIPNRPSTTHSRILQFSPPICYPTASHDQDLQLVLSPRIRSPIRYLNLNVREAFDTHSRR